MSNKFEDMTKQEILHLFPVILTEYQPEWKETYLKEKRVIEQSIGKKNIVRISHIGSTAVP